MNISPCYSKARPEAARSITIHLTVQAQSGGAAVNLCTVSITVP
jgi:hypothetical protein